MITSNELASLRAIANRLADNNKWVKNRFPCDYLVLDTETLGLSCATDDIVQFGFCLVEDCKISNVLWPTSHHSFIVKWPQEKFIGKEAAVNVHGITYEKAQEAGIEPAEALGLVKDIVGYARDKGMLICGHNLYRFDIPYISAQFKKLGLQLDFQPAELFDTAMLVKGMRLGIHPGEGEFTYNYWNRVSDMRAKGVYYSLDRYCIDAFDLAAMGADKSAAHDAGYDSWLVYLLLTRMNELLHKEEVER